MTGSRPYKTKLSKLADNSSGAECALSLCYREVVGGLQHLDFLSESLTQAEKESLLDLTNVKALLFELAKPICSTSPWCLKQAHSLDRTKGGEERAG